MKIEEYYKELSESFEKSNEEMRKNPEKFDEFYKKFQEKYGTKKDNKPMSKKGWTAPARNPYAETLKTSCNQESVLTRPDFINTIGKQVSNYLASQDLADWTDQDFENLAEEVFREIENVKEHYRLDH